MERIAVKSSNLKSVGFDPAEEVLEVEFLRADKNLPARIWQYEKVPFDTYRALINAESPGSYFHTFVRASFEGHRIDSPKEERHEEVNQEGQEAGKKTAKGKAKRIS